MNKVLFDYFDDFAVVYLDDIDIYSRTLEEHVNHLSLVLSQLRKYTLYDIKYLRRLVSKNQVRMDPKKASHYRFARTSSCEGFEKIHCSLLKKGSGFDRLVEEGYKNLKEAIASEPILKLPDFELPFEVHTDSLDKAIGGVLVQEGHPVAFESTRFVVRTDNVGNTFFKTQKKLSPKQARWQEFVEEYDFVWEHKPGKHNQIEDQEHEPRFGITKYLNHREEMQDLKART
uniref:Reverse transcriptase/retrotransposon-derived protein RNase H-like domain-containing protein n=1 Tax=Solanum lycopersicum TaxID=4081 RepID=A0A3Q7GSZ9_SOLLC